MIKDQIKDKKKQQKLKLHHNDGLKKFKSR